MVPQPVVRYETRIVRFVILHTAQDPETLLRKSIRVSHPQTDGFGP